MICIVMSMFSSFSRILRSFLLVIKTSFIENMYKRKQGTKGQKTDNPPKISIPSTYPIPHFWSRSAFVSERQILDDVLVANECVDSSLRSGDQGFKVQQIPISGKIQKFLF